MLKAYLQPNPKLTKTGQIFTITCPEMNLIVKSKTPAYAMCRAIMQSNPEMGTETLEVYRGVSLALTVHKIESTASKALIESDRKGLVVQPYRDPRSIAA